MITQNTSPITASSPSLDHRIAELRGVAADLRVERALAGIRPRSDPSPLRLALGGALLQLGAALVAQPERIRAAPIGAAR